MKRWPTKPLRELCEFRHGNTPSKAEPKNWGGSFPWVSPKDMHVEIVSDTEDHLSTEAIAADRATIAKKNSLLVVVRSGILAHTFPVAIAGRDVAFNQDLKSIRVISQTTTPRYLFRFLQASSPQILTHGTKRGATVQSLQSGFLESLPTPVPPLAEQERIVKLLDEADELRKLRAQADRRTDALIPSLFHEMFGDPPRNAKNWAMSTIGKVLHVLYRYPTFYGTAYVETGVPVARIGNILPSNMLDSDLSNFVRVPKEFSAKFPKTILKAGDLVMAVRGDTTGKIGFVPTALEGANISPNLIRLSPDGSRVTSEYLLWLLLLVPIFVTSRVTDTAKKSITAENIDGIEIPLPPVMLQKVFAARVSEIRAMQAEQTTSRCRLEHLFQSLLHRAFQGEL